MLLCALLVRRISWLPVASLPATRCEKPSSRSAQKKVLHVSFLAPRLHALAAFLCAACIPREIAITARSVGFISYRMVSASASGEFKDGTQFCFDLEMPPDFVPSKQPASTAPCVVELSVGSR